MITIDKAKLSNLHSIVHTILTDTSEVIINFDVKNGVTIHISEKNNVCKSHIELLPEYFEVYNPSIKDIAFSYESLNNIIAFSDKDSKISFDMLPDKKRIKSTFTKEKASFELTFNTISLSSVKVSNPLSEDKINSLKSKSNTYNVPLKEFKTIIGYLKMYENIDNISYAVSMSVNDSNELKFLAGNSSTELGDISVKLDVFDVEKSQESVHSKFGISYLQGLKSELDSVEKEEMYFQLTIGNDMPVIADILSCNKTCFMRFILAPRIVQEDE